MLQFTIIIMSLWHYSSHFSPLKISTGKKFPRNEILFRFLIWISGISWFLKSYNLEKLLTIHICWWGVTNVNIDSNKNIIEYNERMFNSNNYYPMRSFWLLYGTHDGQSTTLIDITVLKWNEYPLIAIRSIHSYMNLIFESIVQIDNQ